MTPRFQDLARIAGPTRDRPPFSFAAAARVAFSDTDAQSIVYYGRYAPYFDVARVEYFRNLGIDPHDANDRDGELVMRHFEIDYHAPAVFDDLLEVFCRVARIGTSSMTFEFAVTNAANGHLLATATQVMVNVDLAQRRPCPVPQRVRDLIMGFEHDGDIRA
jgi:acyl-CoA thioester hydrolase